MPHVGTEYLGAGVLWALWRHAKFWLTRAMWEGLRGAAGYTREGEKDEGVQDTKQVLHAGVAETWEETPQSAENCGC